MNGLPIRALLLTTIGLAIALLLRWPMRRLFGATPAFALWCLPVLLALALWLPIPAHTWSALPRLTALPAAPLHAASAAGNPLHGALPALWLAGALAALLRLACRYVRLLRACRPAPRALQQALRHDLGERDLRRLRLHPDGPAVLWAPRARLLLPADFLGRFDAGVHRLVLRHETAHLRRGDPLWSLLAELAAALLWFHPLAWLALPRFRLDQELACDERVLRDAPQDEVPYARALLRSTGMDPGPALIPWLAGPQLKERLVMIRRPRPHASHRRQGFAALAVLIAGTAALAQAATSTQTEAPARQYLAFNRTVAPRYPADAMRNKQQGLVILRIEVHPDGTVGTIEYDAEHSTTRSAELIAAAADSARRWRFQPETRNGIAVDGYARVPIRFSLDERN